MKFLVLMSIILVSCVSRQEIKTVTYRDPNLLIKGMPKVPEAYVESKLPEKEDPEIYMKSSEISIVEVDHQEQDGSLYSPEDRRQDWFRNKSSYRIGDAIVIHVEQNRTQDLSSLVQKEKDQEGESQGEEEGEDQEKNLEDELLKNFPSLAPSPDSGLSVVRSFKAQIVAMKPNGDAVVMMQRSSKSNDAGKEYSIRGVISGSVLQDQDRLTTHHLSDVDFYESDGAQVLKSHSSDWQDEYTLRMSGFDESQSKYATELESQRKDLNEVRTKLRERLKTFGEERRQIAKERDDLLGYKRTSAERIQKLESELLEKTQSISDLKSQIRELDEARPGEEQDAEGGE